MISVSALSLYLYCPRKLFLEKVLDLEEPPKESLVLGKIRHEIFDSLNKAEQVLVSSLQKHHSILSVYKEKYLSITKEMILKQKPLLREVDLDAAYAFEMVWPHILTEAEQRSLHVHSFMLGHNVFGNDLWQKLTPKFLSELDVQSQEIGLRGIVDKIEVYDKGFVPIEIKTGKTPKEGMWPGHRIQLAAYMMLLEERFGQTIKEGFVYYAQTKERRHLAMNPFLKEEVRGLVKEVHALLDKSILPQFCENKTKCLKCGLREPCYDQVQVQQLLTDISR